MHAASTTRLSLCFSLFASLAIGQTLQFEVASVKLTPPGNANQVNLGYHIDGSQVSFRGLSIKDYVRMAYDVKNYQIVGPDWMGTDRYDITAKLPSGAKEEQVKDMLQSLLKERFHLKLHREPKEFAVYALTVAKTGAKLTESAKSEADENEPKGTNVAAAGGPQGVVIKLPNGGVFNFADNKLEGTKLTTTQFADLLARFVDKPVVDETDLKARYDFSLKLTEEDYRAMQIRAAVSAGVVLPPQALKYMEMASGDSLRTAMQNLGLKLESKKAPLEVLVLESADKTPTDN